MTTPRNAHTRPSRSAANDSLGDRILREAIQNADAGHPDRALAVLTRANLNTDGIRNARGVCLMRMGRVEDALRLFRSLVLAPGGIWMKQELPVIYGTNFCTVLLMARHPAGCLDGLHEIKQTEHPSVIRLYESVDRWQRGLKGLAWLTWKMGAEPNVPVTLDFPPGEFCDPALPSQAKPTRGPIDRRAS